MSACLILYGYMNFEDRVLFLFLVFFINKRDRQKQHLTDE